MLQTALAGVDGIALASASLHEISELGIPTLHARTLMRALSESFPEYKSNVAMHLHTVSKRNNIFTADSAKKLTVPELKAELRLRGKDTSGLKADLVSRLQAVVCEGASSSIKRKNQGDYSISTKKKKRS